jgi:hypothetical protein
MATKRKAASAGDAGSLENDVPLDSSNTCQNNLSERRAQYLSEIFALSPDTACLLAELAFGEVRT